MQEAHLLEAILLVNPGIDDTVRGLERLKRGKDSRLNTTYFDEKLTLFEAHRTLPNSDFCNNLEDIELRDEARFARRHREHKKVQVYQNVNAMEENRRVEARASRVRFLSIAEQQAWERQRPKPPIDVRGETQHQKGEQG